MSRIRRKSHSVRSSSDCTEAAPGRVAAVAWAVAAVSVLLVAVSVPAWLGRSHDVWTVRLIAPAAAALGLLIVRRGVFSVSSPAIVFWTFGAGGALAAATASIPEAAPWMGLGWASVVLVAGMRLIPRLARLVTLAAVLATLATATLADRLPEAAAMGGVIVLLGVTQQMAWNSRRERDRAMRRLLAETESERQAAKALHDVAVSMGSSTTLNEVVPALLTTIAGAFDAGVAALLMVDPVDRYIRVQSPVLVNGAWIPADGHEAIPVSESAIIGQSLRSPRSLVLDVSRVKEARRSILAELGLSSALLGPLRMDGDTVGMVVLGEAASGSFDQESAGHLDLLTGPAALVLAQVERHERAAEINRRLQEVADMKSDFTSMVIHELRSPLTGVMGALDTIAMPGFDLEPDEQAELVDIARRQSHRLKRLVEDLLTLSRNEAGVGQPVLRAARLSQVVRAGAAMVDDDRVSVEIADDTTVEVDPDRLGQVLVNLIENALKYGGGGPVEVRAGRHGDRAEILVIDHGPGIPDGSKTQVFERFVRLEATRHLGGTGLGLPIVKMFVEGMRGDVHVLDTSGGGATFAVRFPLPPVLLG